MCLSISRPRPSRFCTSASGFCAAECGYCGSARGTPAHAPSFSRDPGTGRAAAAARRRGGARRRAPPVSPRGVAKPSATRAHALSAHSGSLAPRAREAPHTASQHVQRHIGRGETRTQTQRAHGADTRAHRRLGPGTHGSRLRTRERTRPDSLAH
eukprot:6412372-Prymnesium_polylepis.1